MCTSSSLEGRPPTDPTAGVDLGTGWWSAIIRTLGSLRILLTGEVDCVFQSCSHNSPELGSQLLGKFRAPSITSSSRYEPSHAAPGSAVVGTCSATSSDPGNIHESLLRYCKTYPVQNLESQQHKLDWGARFLHRLREHCAREGGHKGGILKVWRVEARVPGADIRELSAAEIGELSAGQSYGMGSFLYHFLRVWSIENLVLERC
ncbi:hypothetical protein B0H17DRAFT_1147983 [Mycena rosella]|uniref:Uncharacterized protein n=1 Tax=Mycena rosella TaxID=1033263 RepID=A0AAD7CH61_MYCRO|nr:hypothetical protein B0H17DRAFT_1147983 [Mycena rosella]